MRYADLVPVDTIDDACESMPSPTDAPKLIEPMLAAAGPAPAGPG